MCVYNLVIFVFNARFGPSFHVQLSHLINDYICFLVECMLFYIFFLIYGCFNIYFIFDFIFAILFYLLFLTYLLYSTFGLVLAVGLTKIGEQNNF